MQVTQQWLPLTSQLLPQSRTQQPPLEEHLPSAPPTASHIEQATMYSWILVGHLLSFVAIDHQKLNIHVTRHTFNDSFTVLHTNALDFTETEHLL